MYTTDQLLEIARLHYPSGISLLSPLHDATEESRRRLALCRRAASNRDPFKAVLRTLGERYPNHWIGEETELWTQPSFSVRVSTGRHDPDDDDAIYVVGCVSVLAPIYMTYASRGAGTGRVAYERVDESAEVWNAIHSTFEQQLGVEYVPPDVGLTVVPDLEVGLQQLGHATLYDLLFTSHRW